MMEVPYHYQFRIIVIGDTMVGKSSLLKTLSEGTFGGMEPTVGVDFFSKIIQIKPDNQSSRDHRSTHDSMSRSNRQGDNIIVKLQIWDTAGQERFKSIVTSYYRNSVGIVLVYDVTNRESYDHLIDWFNEARQHVEPSPSPTLSPITQSPPNRLKRINNNHYPLTSTPNASPVKRPAPQSHKANDINNDNSNASDNISLFTPDNYRMAYLVLGCKTDLESQRQVSYEDGQAFADMYGFKFIETSSKMHYNVNQAFQLLAEEIYYKISRSPRGNSHNLTFDGTDEGIRLGPLITRYYTRDRVSLLEAQPVSGGCC